MNADITFSIIFLVKGAIIGILASAPMGPVGVLCIQRTLNKGRWHGFVTGIGAAVSDALYAMFTGLGMSFVMDFISNPSHTMWLQIVGSLLLLAFGIYTFRSKPTEHIHRSKREADDEDPELSVTGKKKKTGVASLINSGITGFLLTFSNPLMIIFFMALFARLNFVANDHGVHYPVLQNFGYLAIMGGALLWWFGLTTAINKVRKTFKMSRIALLNKIIGVIVAVAALIAFVMALSGNHFIG